MSQILSYRARSVVSSILMTDTLLELGADVNGRPDVDPVFPTAPLEYAIALGQDEIADMLRAAGATE